MILDYIESMHALDALDVRVYWNFNRKCWSVQGRRRGIRYRGDNVGRREGRWGSWLVVAHCGSLSLRGVTFKVSEAGRLRVVREQRKNVHAYVYGRAATLDVRAAMLLPRIQYNPYRTDTFTDSCGIPVTKADAAYFAADGKVYAQ